MEDLFRFAVIRPPQPVEERQTVPLQRATAFQASLRDALDSESPRQALQAAAEAFVVGDKYVDRFAKLHWGSKMLELRRRIEESSGDPQRIVELVEEVLGNTPSTVVDSPELEDDSQRLADSIIALRWLPAEHTKPLATLVDVLLTIELVKRLAESDPLLNEWSAVRQALHASLQLPPDLTREAIAVAQPHPPRRQATQTDDPLLRAQRRAKKQNRALDELLQVRPTALHLIGGGESPPTAPEEPATPETKTSRPAGKATPPRGERIARLALSSATAAALSQETKEVLALCGLDPATTSLADLLARLDTEVRIASQRLCELRPESVPHHIGYVGHHPIYTKKDLELGPITGVEESVGESPKAAAHNAGIGELLIVKQQLVRYQGGDVAHIENVLGGESKWRDHRRAAKTEQFLYSEVEREVEEERELESTDRYEIRREAQEGIKESSKLEAGMSLSAGYGPFVQFEANVAHASETTKERSKKFASDFSREVVSRSVNKHSEKIREKRATRVVEEFEETNHHELTNSSHKPISGVYQWVDKVYEAQVFNYGLRQMFEFLVPDPALFLIEGLRRDLAAETGLEKPRPFVLTPAEIDRTNYHQYVQEYQVTGVEPPPEPLIVVSKTCHAGPDTPEAEPRGTWVFSEQQNLPPGYEAFSACAVVTFYAWDLDDLAIDVQIGGRYNRFTRHGWTADVGWGGWGWDWVTPLDLEVESLPLAVSTWQAGTFSLGIEITCRPTARKRDEWRHATHAAILEGYRQRQSEYEERLAALMVREGIEVSGRNPGANRRLERGELKKSCLSLLTHQHFEDLDAVETDSHGLPQVQLERASEVAPFIRFFEQAFEWENMTYVFYPYFWGSRKSWIERLQYEDADPDFVAFVTAGAARVVVPVRRGFENAICHFNDTGNLWQGGDLPEIGDALYLPIIEEIKESLGAPGSEEPTGDPWLVVVPTNLVRLRPDSSLPQWIKDDSGHWVPADAAFD